MAKKHTQDLLKCLEPFDKDIVDRVMWLREFAWDLFPTTNELIYDNYNAVAFGWSPTEKMGNLFCSIAVGRSSKNVHFGFYRGHELSDPGNILLGQGNQYRYILVKDRDAFPKDCIEKLAREAFDKSLQRIKDPKLLVQGRTILKSISAKKRPEKAAKSQKPKI
jgi:hypothetical protein